MAVEKKAVTEILAQMATYLELKGENPFKIRAYENAARIIEGIQGDIQNLIVTGDIRKIKGIGQGIADKLREFAETGYIQEHKKLQKALPPGLLNILKIQGLGPKRAKILHDKLGIQSIADLEKACKKNVLLKLEGFGEKMEENILKGIAFLREHQSQHQIHFATEAAEKIFGALEKNKNVIRIQIAGSIRRRKEVVKDIDIVASSDNPVAVMNTFIQLPEVANIIAHGETKSSIQLSSGINCDLRIVSDKEFPCLLHHLTGSKDHNVAIRGRAQKMGMKVSEWGLFKGKKLIPCKDEEEIYQKLGLTYIPPELRENTGEIEAAEKGKLPKLVDEKDIRGVFHVHSNWSDGAASLEDMVKTALDLGLEYIGLTEHSPSAQYAHGLKKDRLAKWMEEVNRLQKKFPQMKLFKGTECDILSGGQLDWPDEILTQFDFVVGSIHQNFTQPEDKMTARIIRAMENKYLSILGHPTGRLLLERDAYAVNMTKVIDAAADLDVILEINAHPKRLDTDWRIIPYAKKKGVRFAINPDAHRTGDIVYYKYGVGIARKGWLEKDDVMNSLSASQILKTLTPLRLRQGRLPTGNAVRSIQ